MEKINPEEVKELPQSDYTLIVFGKTGMGKSSLLNKLCGIPGKFLEGAEVHSKTQSVESYLGSFFNKGKEKVLFVDTPGLYDAKGNDLGHLGLMLSFMKKVVNGINAVLFTYSLESLRFDSSLQLSLKMLSTLFGKEVFKHTFIVFTFKNALKDKVAENRIALNLAQLPDAFRVCGIDLAIEKHFIFEYDEPDGNLLPLAEFIKTQQKFKPEVLDTVKKYYNLQPHELLTALMENDKNTQEYMAKMMHMKETLNKYSEQLKDYEAKIAGVNKEMKNIKQSNDELAKALQNAHEEQKVAIKKQMEENDRVLKLAAQNHQKAIMDMQIDFKNREASLEAKYKTEMSQFQEKMRKELECVRAEYQSEIEKKNSIVKEIQGTMQKLTSEHSAQLRSIEKTYIEKIAAVQNENNAKIQSLQAENNKNMASQLARQRAEIEAAFNAQMNSYNSQLAAAQQQAAQATAQMQEAQKHVVQEVRYVYDDDDGGCQLL